MHIFLITKPGNGLARQLKDLVCTKIDSIDKVRAATLNTKKEDTVIVYDDQLGVLSEEQIEHLSNFGAITVWQSDRRVIKETLYYYMGVDFCCFGEINSMLLGQLCSRAIKLRTFANATSLASGKRQTAQLTKWLFVDYDRHEVRMGDKEVSLTVTEFKMLNLLFGRPGYVKSRDQLMDACYDEQTYVDDRTIDSHIKRLRQKIKKCIHPNFDPIETLYGLGYRGLEEVRPGIFDARWNVIEPTDKKLAAE